MDESPGSISREVSGADPSLPPPFRTWDGDFERRVGALTPADIRSALTKHIDPEKISFVKAGDFAKAAQTPQTPTPAAPR